MYGYSCGSIASPPLAHWVLCCCSLLMSTRGIARRSRIGGVTAIPALRLAVAVAFSAALLPGAPFDTAPWKYRAPVQAPEPGRICVIPLDRTLYSRMRQDLADLRIVKAGEEAPYVIDTMTGSLEERECRPDLVNRSAAARSGVQVTLDLARCRPTASH